MRSCFFVLLFCALIAQITCRPAQALETAAVAGQYPAPLSDMIGQMIMVGFRGTGNGAPTDDLLYLLEDVREGRIGGVILFEKDYLTKKTRNIESGMQVLNLANMLQTNAPIPLFIAVDQEGGKVRRFYTSHGAPATPSAAKTALAAPEAARAQGAELGKFLAKTGVNVDFAPVVDLNLGSPAISAFERSFSDDAEIVSAYAGAFAQGLASSGIIYCYKHFPGHGSAKEDSHHGYADITNTWTETELEPYKRLLYNDMPGMVMAGHLFNSNLDPRLPASLSPAAINGLLRQKLGWHGVVITDDLQMKAVTDEYSLNDSVLLAIDAGVDIILIGNNISHDPRQGRKLHNFLLQMAKSGRIQPRRIQESYQRIMRLKAGLSTRNFFGMRQDSDN